MIAARLVPRQPLRRLFWRLALLNLLATALSLLFVELLLVVITAAFLLSPGILRELESDLRDARPGALRFFEKDPPDVAGLSHWLDREAVNELRPDPPGVHLLTVSAGGVTTVVADARTGSILASTGDVNAFPPGEPLAARLSPAERGLLARCPGDEACAERVGERMVAVGTLVRADGQVVAFGIIRSEPLYSAPVLGRIVLSTVLNTFLVAGVGAGIVGGCLSLVTARSVTRRLSTISQAADSWAAGDLTATAPESPADEFGLLALRLNRMARDLDQVMTLRNAVAVLEERQRITRDLHDTVKQHAFAAAMVIGSARRLLDAGEAEGAGRALDEAAVIAAQMQTDLSGILHQMRGDNAPGSLTDRLRHITDAWRQRSGMAVRLEAPCPADADLPGAVAEQAARIAEEAVANAVKHGGARTVTVSLTREGDRFRLAVHDDGAGFDTRRTAGNGLGLHTMRERASLLPGGTLEITSAPGAGTSVALSWRAEGEN